MIAWRWDFIKLCCCLRYAGSMPKAADRWAGSPSAEIGWSAHVLWLDFVFFTPVAAEPVTVGHVALWLLQQMHFLPASEYRTLRWTWALIDGDIGERTPDQGQRVWIMLTEAHSEIPRPFQSPSGTQHGNGHHHRCRAST